jgi:hypothetical protein
MTASMLNGKWTYRSFLNKPDMVGNDPNKALALIFGEGILSINVTDEATLRAVLDFGGASAMDLVGTIFGGSAITPEVLIITGTGREGTNTAKWVYQYQGYVVPSWPQGVNQVPAIVGTVVRTIPHGSGPAGVVASFVIVKQTST